MEKNPLAGVDPLVVTVSVRQTPPPIITRALDMTGNRGWPEWANNSDMQNLSAFTLEGLFCADDFKASGSLNTLFGIEGNFLVRIGDAGIPSNRLQIATGGGNFTNAAAVFETGRWYHVAVTFGNRTVTAYIDGEVVFSGTTSSSTYSLGAAHSNESDTPVERFYTSDKANNLMIKAGFQMPNCSGQDWFNRFWEDETLRAAVNARWKEKRAELVAAVKAAIDERVAAMPLAVEANFTKWEFYYQASTEANMPAATYEAEIERIRSLTDSRAAVLDGLFAK